MLTPIPARWLQAEVDAEIAFRSSMVIFTITQSDEDKAIAAKALADWIDAGILIKFARELGYE